MLEFVIKALGLSATNTKDDKLSSVDDALNVIHDGTAFTTLDMINVLLSLIPMLFSPFAYVWFYRDIILIRGVHATSNIQVCTSEYIFLLKSEDLVA